MARTSARPISAPCTSTWALRPSSRPSPRRAPRRLAYDTADESAMALRTSPAPTLRRGPRSGRLPLGPGGHLPLPRKRRRVPAGALEAVFGMVPDAEGTYAGYVNQRFGEQVVLETSTAMTTVTSPARPIGGDAAWRRQRRMRGDLPRTRPLRRRPWRPRALPLGSSRPPDQPEEPSREEARGGRRERGWPDRHRLRPIPLRCPEASGTNHGVVRLFLGGPLSEEPPTAFEPASGADYSWFGANSGDGLAGMSGSPIER